MSLFLLFVLAFFTTTRCDLNSYVPYDYCNPKLKLCRVPGSHTMCRYPVAGPSQDCAPFINEPLTPAEKIQILSLHNKLRNKVASGKENTPLGRLPSASNMLQMRWDEELEIIAERWAERCFNVTVTKIHDDCRNTKRFRVTQNIGTIGLKGVQTEKQNIQIFYQWYITSKSFNPRLINDYVVDDNKTSEEFINLIWADTYALGCASVMFRNNLTDSQDGGQATPWTFERIVCNYGPGGFIPGKPVYKTGKPCSQCPTGWICSREYKALCTLRESATSSAMNTTEVSSTAAERKVVSSTFRYPSSKMSRSRSTANGVRKWSTSSVDNRTEKYNFKLRIGFYHNGVCHCPDISRYGFEEYHKHETNPTEIIEKLKSLVPRSVGNMAYPANIEKNIFGLKNGDRCYCKTSVPNSGGGHASSTITLCLTNFFLLKLFMYCLK